MERGSKLADLASIAPDALRFGKGIGCALFNDQASGYDKARAVARDVGRGLTVPGAGIAARAAFRAAKGIGKAVSKARAPKGIGKEIGILRDAAKGKGNFGLGSATRAEADRLGKAWVGPGARVASDGKTLISKDGLRQYRPPTYKSRLGKTQANFERRFPGQITRRWQSNAHLDITN